MYIRFIISKLLISLALTLTFISCSVELYMLAPYNEGIMYEYQFRNGRYELKVTFSRNKKTGQLRSIRFETNGQFVKKPDDNGNDNKDNIFVVDPKAADIRLGEKTLKLGNSLTSLGNYTVRNNYNMEEIIISATTPPSLGLGVFGSTNNCPIYVPDGSVSSYQAAWSSLSSRIIGISNRN